MELSAATVWRLGGLILLGGLVWFAARLFEWRNIYRPARVIEYTPADEGLAFEEVEFMAEDGARLHGWWIPANEAAGTLLFCHGNAGNIGNRVGLLPGLHELGWNIFLFDYRGYGKSRGVPTERGTYRDARAAFEYVRVRHDDAEYPPVVAWGRSLGAAVAIQLALDKPVRGLIVEGAFTSVPDMARLLFPGLPLGWFCRFRYDSLKKVPRLGIPKLFAHGKLDAVIPFALGRALYEAAAPPKRFFALEGGHDEVGWVSSPEYEAVLREFLAQVDLRNTPPMAGTPRPAQ